MHVEISTEFERSFESSGKCGKLEASGEKQSSDRKTGGTACVYKAHKSCEREPAWGLSSLERSRMRGKKEEKSPLFF